MWRSTRRYSIGIRHSASGSCRQALDYLVPSILVFERDDVLEAKDLLDSAPGLSARDAIHIAVMRRAGVTRILSFDRAFDAFPALERLG